MTRSQQPMWDDIARVPAQDVQPHPENPREGDVAEIANMIKENGWHGVLVVQRSTGYIVVGNHRYKAGLTLGMDTFPVHYVDVDNAQATRILLADNRASDIATYNDEKLLRLVAQVGDADTAVAILADPQATTDERNEALKVLKSSPYAGTGYRAEDVTQLAMDLSPDTTAMDTTYRTPDDMAERYEQTTVRQVMLVMDELTYGLMVPALAAARKAMGYDTNDAVVLKLLDDAGYVADEPAKEPDND